LPVVVAAAVVAALLPTIGLAPSPVASAAPSCVSVASDPTSAASVAKACRQRVEVSSARSETGQVFAEPDGTQTMEQSAVPVRVHRPDGSWADVDPTLQRRADGSWAPRVALADVALSGGGSNVLATLTTAGVTMTFGWPLGSLPAPSVVGDTATYPSVLPGVDLAVEVSAVGFRPVLVVKDASAATSPALTNVRYPVGGNVTVRTSTDGRVRIADPAGRTVAAVAGASMWDSSTNAVPTGAAPTGTASTTSLAPASSDSEPVSTPESPGAEANVAVMPVSAVAGAIAVTPVKSMLSGSGVTYPVFIDPGVSISPTYSKWNYADSGNDTWDTNTQAWVGRNPYDGQLFRSYFQFPTTQGSLTIKHKTILKASFDIVLDHSWSCLGAATLTFLYRTSALTAGNGGRMSFNTRPLGSGAKYLDSAAASANEDNGCSDSPEPDLPVEFTSTAFKTDVQTSATAAAPTYTVGMCACDTAGAGESIQSRWKRYKIDSRVKFIVNYDTPPSTPDRLTVSDQACGSYVGTRTPVLQARAVDLDTSDTETMTFQYQQIKPTAGSVVAKTASSVPANNYGHVTTGTLTEDYTYQFRVQVTDASSYSSAWSGWCQFTINTSNPPTPTVTSTTYPCDQSNLASCVTHGGPGVSGAFSFSVGGNTSVTKYKYGWTTPPATTVTVAAGAGYTVTLTPPRYGLNTLFVADVDNTNKTSGIRAYQFLVGAPSAPLAYWKLDDMDGLAAYADRQGGTGLSVDPTDNDVTAAADAHYVGSASVPASATGFGQKPGAPNGVLTAAEPGLDTTKSFSVSAWARISDLSAYHAVVSKGGGQESVFQLEYRVDQNAWCFVLRSKDVSGASTALACGSTPTVGRWTHLLGVYDDSEHTLTLYVNGTAYSTGLTTLSPFYTDWNGGWNATGPLMIGAVLDAAARHDSFVGQISDVRVWTRVVTRDDLAGADDDGGGIPWTGLLDARAVSARVSWWNFAGQSPDCGCLFDEIGQDHFSRAISPSGSGVTAIADDHDGNAAWSFDGSGGYGQATGPVLRTDQSFTVMAWTRLAPTCSGSAGTIVAQDGANVSAFALEYNCSQQKWRFWVSGPDSTTGPLYAALSPTVTRDDDWHLIVGVYDAGASQVRLYVDGDQVGTATVSGTVFNAAGPFTIGRQKWVTATGFLTGDIDEVGVWQGVLPDYYIADLVTTT
jgi:hypothetical protein